MREFAELISPLSEATFLSDFWNKSFLHLTGSSGRFRSLMTWSDVNSLLERGCLKPPALRLWLDGKPIDQPRYMTSFGVNAGGLIACLSQGATLIIDQISNLTPGVRELAEACEDALKISTNVNLYAGWRSQ